jgi:hypothetical protein
MTTYRGDRLAECVRVAVEMWAQHWHSCQEPICLCEKTDSDLLPTGG